MKVKQQPGDFRVEELTDIVPGPTGDFALYRLDKVGRVNSEQMAREGVLITRHPLLIQKTLADKLSDKIQVVIAPPPADGGFIGAGLVGALKTSRGSEVRSDAVDTEIQPTQAQ